MGATTVQNSILVYFFFLYSFSIEFVDIMPELYSVDVCGDSVSAIALPTETNP